MRRLLRLTLRDLFWVQILAAVAIAWAWEHYQLVRQKGKLEQSHSLVMRSKFKWRRINPPATRQERFHQLEALSRDELMQRELQTDERGHFRIYGHDFAGLLTEYARRGMKDELQKIYDEAEDESMWDRRQSSRLQRLTALRRAQILPDPIKIRLEVMRYDKKGVALKGPCVAATIQNVDANNETIHLSVLQGIIRNSRWQACLVDSFGRRVDQSNYGWRRASGTEHEEKLRAKEISNEPFIFDLRYLVAPPATGSYTLRMFHSEAVIQDDEDLEGLIVWTSEPLRVQIENSDRTDSFGLPFVLLMATMLTGLLLLVGPWWKNRDASNDGQVTANRLLRHDLIAVSLIAATLSGWLWDSHHLKYELSRLRPDWEANWTIRQSD